MITLLHGDCLELLPTLPAESVDSVVTDPPYHLTSIVKRFGSATAAPAKGGVYARSSAGFMGQTWDGGDIAFRPEVWAEVWRVLKPGGHLLAFSGTRTQHRMVCAIEDAGFEIRDQIGWLYGSGFPKSHDVSKGIDKAAGAEREIVGRKTGRAATPVRDIRGGGLIDDRPNNLDCSAITAPATDAAKQWAGWGTALKPAWEPICVARKPLSEPTVAANVLKWGTGAINIDACRISSITGQRPSGDDGWASDQPLCDLCAEGAAGKTKPPAPATKASTATKRVAPISSEKAEMRRGRTSPSLATECSGGTPVADMFASSSIGVSGKTPTDRSQPGTKSTTSTKTSSTIGSPICSSCGRAITSGTTGSSTSPEMTNSRHGQKPSVSAERGSDLTPNGSRKSGSEAWPSTTAPGQPLARFPANLCHDGSDEVLEAFARAGERRTNPKTQTGYSRAGMHGGGITNDGGATYPGDTGTAARFFFCAKASKTERAGSKHPTVKPIALMQWLCRLVTHPGGTVLDPFAGSGSTGVAASREGFDAVLIEREAEYVADIRARSGLFAEVA